MNILVLNCGSSSLKYQVFNMNTKKSIEKGKIERISNYKKSIEKLIKKLNIKIDAIGHRVVHGGEEFSKPVIINNKVIKQIKSCIPLAPLHNPANLEGIKVCQKIMQDIPQVAIFDTAFYQSMKKENFLYPIPFKYYTRNKIRKYGFHGTSHDYVSHKACKILGKTYNKQNIISCHIGNGASITAIKKGKVLETSMGMTPLDGLMMGTRSGSIDPSIIGYLHRQEKSSIDKIEETLNKKSGLLGISEKSEDMRDIISGIEKGDKKCQIAHNMYINRIVKYIGAYIALMGGVNTIVFTGGVMENRPSIRKDVIKKLNFIGAKLDINKNKVISKTQILSKKDSTVDIILLPTNEEYMIAKHTYKLVKSL